MSDQVFIGGIGVVEVNTLNPPVAPGAQPLEIRQWERERAQKAAELTRQVLAFGVRSPDQLAAITDHTKLTPEQDPILRRVIYGLLGALDKTEPWFTEAQFFNGWQPIARPPHGPGGLSGAEPVGYAMATLGVCKDPFGFTHWRGGVTRTGTAPSRQLIMTLPGRYGPGGGQTMVQALAVANDGVALIEISRSMSDGLGLDVCEVWLSNVVSSITGGFGANPRIDLSPITPYDSRA